MKKASTLAEILIVLAVIGIITAILLPAARHMTPDENVLKFKKANATLGRVIHELVSSDQYNLDGDLGKMPDGSLVNSPKYFCESLSDLLSTKKVECSDVNEGADNAHLHLVLVNGVDNTDDIKTKSDSMCLSYPKNEITLQDGTIFYEVSPYHHFAVPILEEYPNNRLFGNPGYWNDTVELDSDGNVISYTVNSSFDLIYKIFCIDIDGINKGEDPFGYGIRADGKILYGARASEWMEKSIQNKD